MDIITLLWTIIKAISFWGGLAVGAVIVMIMTILIFVKIIIKSEVGGELRVGGMDPVIYIAAIGLLVIMALVVVMKIRLLWSVAKSLSFLGGLAVGVWIIIVASLWVWEKC